MKRLKPHLALAALSAMASMSYSSTDTRRGPDTGDPPGSCSIGNDQSMYCGGPNDFINTGGSKKEVTAWSGSSTVANSSICSGTHIGLSIASDAGIISKRNAGLYVT